MDKHELKQLSAERIKKREAIVKVIKGQGADVDMSYPLDEDTIIYLSEIIERAGLIDFYICHRQNEMDDWLQVEVYNELLGKTIIFNYDYRGSFENMNDFINHIMDTNDDIVYFNSRIRLESEVDNE